MLIAPGAAAQERVTTCIVRPKIVFKLRGLATNLHQVCHFATIMALSLFVWAPGGLV